MPTPRPHAGASPARTRIARRAVRAALAGLTATALVGLPTLLVGVPAAAQEEPTGTAQPTTDPSGPPIGPVTAGTEICTVDEPELDEITGMVATGDVIYAVEGGATAQPFVVEIWTINATTCEASSETYGFPPIDPQDLALGSDGALWVADIGLGSSERSWLTMERVDLASGADAVPYRALVPDGPAIGGSAVLLEEDNTPIIIANSGQAALLLRPDGPLPANTTEGLPKLQQVGQFAPVNTDTPTPRGAFGRLFVTGAAIAPDRSRVVLRTESDAYEFTVENGDIVTSITEGTPTITPLPDEANGQAISYSADGSKFLTLTGGANPVLRSYEPYDPPDSTGGGGGGGGSASGGGGNLSFGDITTIALITGFLGLAAVVAGTIGIVVARRRYFEEHPEAKRGGRPRGRDRAGRSRPGTGPGRRGYDDDEYEPQPAWPSRTRDDDPEWDGAPPRAGRAPAWVGSDDDYGSASPGPGPRPHAGSSYGAGGYGGSTYGPGGDGGGQVYGSGRSGGTTYGSGGTTYGSGSGGTTYGSGSGGTTYGSGAHGSTGRAPAPGGRGGGGVYGRPRTDRDEDNPRPYGRDNIDL